MSAHSPLVTRALAALLIALSAPAGAAINLVGVDAGSLRAGVPPSNFANGSVQYGNGTATGPAQGSIDKPWVGFQAGGSVTVEDYLSVYSGHAYAKTSFTSGGSGAITPSMVHSLSLYAELANWDSCCGLDAASYGDLTFRFDIPGAPGPIHDGTGALINAPSAIYFVYEWTAIAQAGDHAWNTGSVYNTDFSGGGLNPNGGGWAWSMPNLPIYDQMFTGTASGNGAGVFYTWTGGDYRFQFPLDVLAAGIWTRDSFMDIRIRLAFSETPFTALPSAVPLPAPVVMLGTALIGLIRLRRSTPTAG